MNQILRAPWHDYTSRCIYMITINKHPLSKPFGTLDGDYHIPVGITGSPFIRASRTGIAIKDTIRQFYQIEENIKILQYALMPDHLHLLIFVENPTEEILGRIIARFKVAVNERAGSSAIFAKGFNDQILKTTRSLDTLFRYLRDNPRRLAMRRAHPEFFRRVNELRIGERSYRAYGNFQLLDYPFREQVVVHRADSPEVRRNNHDLWMYSAYNGGVLVGPFISPAEKAIRAEAEAAGARLILITAEPMDDRYKPHGRDFALCEAGRMLIVSTGTGGGLTRPICLAMNALAKALTGDEYFMNISTF